MDKVGVSRMAQVNIAHFTDIDSESRRKFTQLVRDLVAYEVHGLEKAQIRPDSVTVLVMPVDIANSLSGAETELQVLVSGNDWPRDNDGQPISPKEAKTHFDMLASRVFEELSNAQKRKIYVWITPFAASGWAE
jgi:hypothetical protein